MKVEEHKYTKYKMQAFVNFGCQHYYMKVEEHKDTKYKMQKREEE
jgi:hypothetical protein